MVAQDGQYHRNCLLNLYNRGWELKEMAGKVYWRTSHRWWEVIGFNLADLAQFYTSMEQLRVKHEGRVQTNHLKQILLAHFRNKCAQYRHDDLLAFNEDPGDALANACKLDNDVLLSTWRVLPKSWEAIPWEMLGFNEFPAGCQQDSLLPILLAWPLRSWRSSTKHQSERTALAAKSIAQLHKSYTVMHPRAGTGSTPRPVRHIISQEKAVSTHIGLMLHAHTRKRMLVTGWDIWGFLSPMIGSYPFTQYWGTLPAASTSRRKVVWLPRWGTDPSRMLWMIISRTT